MWDALLPHHSQADGIGGSDIFVIYESDYLKSLLKSVFYIQNIFENKRRGNVWFWGRVVECIILKQIFLREQTLVLVLDSSKSWEYQWSLEWNLTLKCRPFCRWINKLWYICIMEYDSMIMRNEVSSHGKTWRKFKFRLLGERSEVCEDYILCNSNRKVF